MKYRKKPVVIEAIQLTDKNIRAVYEFAHPNEPKIGEQLKTREDEERFDDYCQSVKDYGLFIDTLEGKMHASIGDFIIKGIKGEIYPCKPDIFAATYEEADKALTPSEEQNAALNAVDEMHQLAEERLCDQFAFHDENLKKECEINDNNRALARAAIVSPRVTPSEEQEKAMKALEDFCQVCYLESKWCDCHLKAQSGTYKEGFRCPRYETLRAAILSPRADKTLEIVKELRSVAIREFSSTENTLSTRLRYLHRDEAFADIIRESEGAK